MNFAEAAKKATTKTFTENGMPAKNTTSNACLDLFASIGALRLGSGKRTDLQPNRARVLFDAAYEEDPLTAVKTVFYARDVREGLGERDVPRALMNHMATYHKEAMSTNLDLLGFYGRYDDLYSLVGTPLEDEMWQVMKAQFEKDKEDMMNNLPISLLAKWIKTPDASSKTTRKLGILTAGKLGYSVYEFKRLLRSMRKYIDVVERKMSANQWNAIQYPSVPSRAAMIYRNAFKRHDETRYATFVQNALEGKVKIHSDTLYPYDLVERVWNARYDDSESDATLEAQWRQLPNYVDEGKNVLVMADVSGSMTGRPIASSVGLALYFAEHNTGAFHNLFMTFSGNPEFVNVKGATLADRLEYIERADWGMNTDMEAAFDMVLDTAVRNHIVPADMPAAIVVITDMEFDAAARTRFHPHGSDWTFYDEMKTRFEEAGYQIPHLVFWNVRAEHATFHADANRKGVTMVSGHATSSFKAVIKSIGMNPVEMMNEVLNSERYAPITVAET